MARTNFFVRTRIECADPQLEIVQAEDMSAKFLDGTVQASSLYFIVDYTPGLATLRAGAIHGISSSTTDGTTVFALFLFTASDQDLSDLEHAVGMATVIAVHAATCQLVVTGLADPNTSATFKAVVVGLPTSRLVIRLEGETQGVESARTALNASSHTGGPSLYIREADGAEPAEFRLLAQRQYFITRSGSNRPLAESIQGYLSTAQVWRSAAWSISPVGKAPFA